MSENPVAPLRYYDFVTPLRQALSERILVLDGAMGTMIQRHGFGEADFRGERFAEWPTDVQGNNDLLSITQPDAIHGIHSAYLEAGADIIETDTFNANSIGLGEFGLDHMVAEVNGAAGEG